MQGVQDNSQIHNCFINKRMIQDKYGFLAFNALQYVINETFLGDLIRPMFKFNAQCDVVKHFHEIFMRHNPTDVRCLLRCNEHF